MKFKDIPIPRKMQDLQRDRRGYPVPFVVMRDTDGAPHFTINDYRQTWEAEDRALCNICGKPIRKSFWFSGGVGSATHEGGYYNDGPMHGECARYALRVCPYLAHPSWGKTKRIDDAMLDRSKFPDHINALKNLDMHPVRPDVFVLGMCSRYVGTKVSSGCRFKPHRPWKKVEVWKDGSRVMDEGVMRAAAQITSQTFGELKYIEHTIRKALK